MQAVLGATVALTLMGTSVGGTEAKRSAPFAHREDGATAAAPLCHDVRDYGARGDAASDDTTAFNSAAAAAAASGGRGCVYVPPVAAGLGYVITGTVKLPVGVALIGTLAGMPVVPWMFGPPYDVNSTGGPRILAMPTRERKPLFVVNAGCTVRGLFVWYPNAPYPTDAQFSDPSSKFHYVGGFAEAAAHFYADHVPAVGPTFHVVGGTRVVLEDLAGSGWRDFIYFSPGCGQSHVRRVHGWGFGRFVTVEAAEDVLSFDTLRYIVNAGPNGLGHVPSPAACRADPDAVRCRGNFTWLPGVVALHPDNVGLWLGRCDGYVARDLFFFGVNTAMRLGASAAFPITDPSTGQPVTPLEPATGPWGAVSQLMVDQCVRGIHFVWPNPLSNRFSELQIHPSFWVQGESFAAVKGSGGGLGVVGTEAAVAVEPTHSRANNKGLSAPTMLSHVVVASFNDSGNFGPASCTLTGSNGRVFAVRGDILFLGFGLSVNNVPNASTMLWAAGAGARFSLRFRGVILNDTPVEDVDVNEVAGL